MKRKTFFFTLILLLFTALTGHAQVIYNEVYFTDKPAGQTFALSQKSLAIKAKQGITPGEADKPVNVAYIQELRTLGYTVVMQSRWLNMAVVALQKGEPAVPKLPFIREIKSKQSVDYTKAKEKLELPITPVKQTNTKRSAVQEVDYGYAKKQTVQLNLHKVHALGFRGKGITIAVLDAGFNQVDSLRVFDSLRNAGRLLGTRDFVEAGKSVFDSDLSAHGTYVLSCMAANIPGWLVGTAPDASYYLFRTEDARSETIVEEYNWLVAAEYADSLGVHVINSSLGYTEFDDPAQNHTYADMDGNTTVITRAADMAASRGILVVNSAGNEGNSLWKYIGAPADGDSVLSVGAVDSLGVVTSFSSRGPASDGRIKPDVAAMGSYVTFTSLDDRVLAGGGTSFSSPLIAGAAASLWQAFPDETNMEIRRRIVESGHKFNEPDTILGYGIPDFLKAMNMIPTQTDPSIEIASAHWIYPNPFVSGISIRARYPYEGRVQVRLYNLAGQIIHQALFNGYQNAHIERPLKPGMYLLQVNDSTGTRNYKIFRQ